MPAIGVRQLGMSLSGSETMTWDDGDYATAGDLWATVGERLVEDVGVAGLDVLDVATGTGMTAIAAARAGGRVTAVDVTPDLLEIARARAGSVGLTIRWITADMQATPLGDAGFDRVLSTFGAMFAAEPRAMARELVRLCRPGGLIAACAWTPDGVFGRIAPTVARFLPSRPPGPSPTAWGTPGAAGFFTDLPVAVSTALRTVEIRFASVEAATVMFERKPGPIQAMRRVLEPLGRWPAARAALCELFARSGMQARDGLVLDVPYLVLVARRAPVAGS
jgi:SAM-dependent methyltransferase